MAIIIKKKICTVNFGLLDITKTYQGVNMIAPSCFHSLYVSK